MAPKFLSNFFSVTFDMQNYRLKLINFNILFSITNIVTAFNLFSPTVSL